MHTRLRWLAIAEGTTLIALIAIAVPLKHFAGVPAGVKLLGPIHGVCFVLYVIALADAVATQRIPPRVAVAAFAAAFVPGGGFLLARRLGRSSTP